MLRRGAFEFFVIVAGILAAFYVDEFRDARRIAALEEEYAERLQSDLADAVQNLTTGAAWAADRADGGRSVISHLAGEEELAPSALAAAAYGAGLVPIARERRLGRRTTFDELVSTGNLGTIQDTELRDRLARYYEEYARIGGRVEDWPADWRESVGSMLHPDVILALEADRVCRLESATPSECVLSASHLDLARFSQRLAEQHLRFAGELNRIVQYQDRQRDDLLGFLTMTETMLADLRESGLVR